VNGHVIAAFVIVLAAAEAAVALAIVLAMFRNFGTVHVDTVNRLKR
jgi:NADH-quinone oxidoreductase subunit K